MKKRSISLFLALVMVLSLFPMAAFAADGGDSSVNPATGREAGPAGNRKVAMMLYGKTISDAVMKSNYDIDDFWAALKAEAQGVLGSEKIPEVEVYLVNDQNQEYKLEPSDGRGASMVNSFRLSTGGILALLDDVFDWLTDFYDWVLGDMPTVGQLYKIYRVDNVPEGDYTLEVRSLDRDGYTFLRNNSAAAKVDSLLNKLTDGKTGTILQDTLSGSADVTAMGIAFGANLIYNNLDTSNRIVAETTAIQNMVKENVTKVVSKALTTAGNTVAKFSKWLIKMATK